MSDTIKHIAQSLKADLKAPFPANLSKVVAFADEYALNRERYFSVVLLNRQFVKAPSEEVSAALLPQAIELIDQILEEYDAASEDIKEKVAQQQAVAGKRLKEHPFFPEHELILRTVDLEKRYGKDGFRLHDINIELRLGDILGVVGKNANGKTTLFNLLAGQQKATSGDIAFPSFSTAEQARKFWSEVLTQTAYVPQSLSQWYGELRTNIQFEAALRGVPAEENELKTDFIIQRLDLEEHLDKSWSELSGGYKLRFALAKALVWQPRLLLLDEPLANLDVNAQQLIINDLRNLAKSLRNPISVIVSSQHLHEIEAISDKILFLEDGAPAFYGAAQGIGAEKKYQVFELQPEGESLATLKEKLSIFADLSVLQAGVNYVIECPMTYTKEQILSRLISEQVQLLYFRDISNSVKRLFTSTE